MAAARLQDFTQMNPPIFFVSKSEEDPKEFLVSILKVTEIMGVNPTKSTDLDAYQFHRVDHTLYKKRKDTRGADTGLVVWDEFVTAFFNGFFPLELKGAKM